MFHLQRPWALMEALRGASIVEEHRTLMGMVVERVRSAKSVLNQAYTSLLTGFEVCEVMYFWLFTKGITVYR